MTPKVKSKKTKRRNGAENQKEKTYPILKDFYKTLKHMKQRKLCSKLEKLSKVLYLLFLILKPTLNLISLSYF